MPSNARTRLMPGSFLLGRVGGIPVGLHYSWFLIAALITFSLSAQFRVSQPDWAPALIWGTALVTSLLFFVSLLAHELAHLFVARARGLSVRSITLFALGGLAQTDEESDRASTEFLIAIAGPIMSVALGFACLAAAMAFGWSPQADGSGALAAMLGWLGSINILLALFNMLPGYPLDGGRVLRAGLWAWYDDVHRATRAAARTGQAVAGLFIAFGLFQFFAGAGLGGLWLAFIGWFLLVAAQSSYEQVAVHEMLRDVRVGDVMVNDCATAEPRAKLEQLVDEVLLRTGKSCIVVKRDEQVVGLMTLRDVRSIERRRWAEVTAGDVMRPLERLHTVTPSTPVTEALQLMAREDLNQLPVVSNGHLDGIVARGHILGLLEARSALRAA
jgi:Zn-dependent protease/predicted transcriptional regulator